jgi:long-subunit acyl-CoA synthetase (AMP-forming)
MDHPRLLLDHAYQWEAKTPDTVWLTQPMGAGEVKTYTWAQALDEARRMATHLASLELPPRSNIAIISKNCAEFLLSDLAIWMAGHVSVALYPTLSADTVQYCLEHSESKLLFVGKLDDWESIAAGVPDHVPRIAYTLASPNDFDKWDDIAARNAPMSGRPHRAEDELAVIIYTSGSTGRPKGVMHSFGSMSESTRRLIERMDTLHTDRMLSYLPLAHAMERWFVECQSILAGFNVFFAESLDTFVQDLQRARPTIFISVPRLWMKFQIGVFDKMPPHKLQRMLKIPLLNRVVKKKIMRGLGLDTVRLAGSGSAPIPAELIQWYRDLGLELLEGYGMSEDFACSHVSEPGKGRVGYVGTPYPGVEVKISDEGEVLVKSPGNMLGYYKEPEMTAACYTEDGFFKTGDRGERDEAGRLKITGRTKELFKTSKGKYVAPAPIENLLNTSPNVELSCVSGSGQPQPFAVLALAEDLRGRLGDEEARKRVHAELKALRQEVNGQLEHHEQLAFIAIAKDPWLIENGFLTPTMKLRRAQIDDAYRPFIDGWYALGEPVVWQDAASI